MAAKLMVSRLRACPRRAALVHDMDRLCVAYIELANWNVDRYKNETNSESQLMFILQCLSWHWPRWLGNIWLCWLGYVISF